MTSASEERYLTPPETPSPRTAVPDQFELKNIDLSDIKRRSHRKRRSPSFLQVGDHPENHETTLSPKAKKRKTKEIKAEPTPPPPLSGPPSGDKIEVKRSLFPAPDPSTQDQPTTQAPDVSPPSSNQKEEEEMVEPLLDNAKEYPYHSLVWGKLKGYDWWPGRIAHYKELNLSPCPAGSSWVRWFGEKQVSDIPFDCIDSLFKFSNHLMTSKLKGSYKKGIFQIIKEAARRSGKEFKEALKSATVAKEKDSEVKDNETNETEPSENQEEEGNYRMKVTSKGVRLSALEEEMLYWAMNGFPPKGEEGFKHLPTSSTEESLRMGSPLSGSDSPDTISWDGTAPSRTVVGRAKLNEDSGEFLEAAPKKTPFRGPLSLREMITIPGGRIDTFDMIREGKHQIKEVCLACGNISAEVEHPFFEGSLCKTCKDIFMECCYLFDDDGSQMYCSICSAGEKVFMCDKPNCAKVYCGPCIRKFCGQEELDKVEAADEWFCYMCTKGVGLLHVQEDWSCKLHDLFVSDIVQHYDPPKSYPAIPPEDRKPIRVLGLFDGIATGLLVLKDLGIAVDTYISSEVDQDAIKVSQVHFPEIRHVGNVEDITEKHIAEWGPFDLVMGGSPCNDLSIVNPARKGIYDGTGRLFFEFFRILSYCRPPLGEERPFFWLFENVVSMRAHDKQIISRFLQSNPFVVDAKDISPAHRARYFWGNVPGMQRCLTALPGDRLTLQECLEHNCNRKAKFPKVRTITTKMNSIKQTKKALMPVEMDNGEDVLWCTEMERLFGFPDHYTDAANLGRHGRQKLLGRAWSVPVIRHIFSPLKEYFQSSTQLTVDGRHSVGVQSEH